MNHGSGQDCNCTTNIGYGLTMNVTVIISVSTSCNLVEFVPENTTDYNLCKYRLDIYNILNTLL